jgi:hypothetical protein
MSATTNMQDAIELRERELCPMQITIEPTDQVTTVNDAPCRLWNGTTDKGVACVLYVALVQVKTEESAGFNYDLSDVTRKVHAAFAKGVPAKIVHNLCP